MRKPASSPPPNEMKSPLVGQIPLGDVEIAFTEVPGTGPTLVLLHGLTGHRDDFLPILPALHARHPALRILAPDLRGHGDSTHGGDPAAFGFAQLVDDLARLLDRRGVDRCHLLGHSFGGMLSLRFALDRPARLESLLLASTAPFAPAAFTAEMFERGGEIARSRGMGFLQQLIEQRARSAAPQSPSDRQVARWSDSYWPHHRHRLRSMDPRAYELLGLAMVRQEPVTRQLGRLSLPVTVLIGLDDQDFLAGADALATGIPDAIRVDVPDAGHHPHRENPQAWLDGVAGHLARAAAFSS